MVAKEKVLVAISVRSIHRAYDPRFMAATLRGQSTTKGASFEDFETAMFSAHSIIPFETLHKYGFTVVEAPDGWSYDYQNSWHETVIRQAIKQVTVFQNHYQRQDVTSGYDQQLAEEVLAIMNKAYPQLTTLIQLKHELSKEPSDEALSTVLSALSGDGLITEAMRHTLSKDGRRYIQDEMTIKTAKFKQAVHVNDASTFIFAQLLSEFRERKLTSDDLRNTYQGLSPAELG
jgi:hypothetical protein